MIRFKRKVIRCHNCKNIIVGKYETFNGNKYCNVCISDIAAFTILESEFNELTNVKIHDNQTIFNNDFLNLLKPSEIKSQLDDYIIGQDRAKRTISVAAYNHFKRINTNNEIIEKSNIIMIGPTGSGKTYLIRTLARILDVPFSIFDATSLTETGYVGKDVESLLVSLVTAANGNIEKAEKGIIFIDEIDKLRKQTTSGRVVGGEGVQQALLKIIEGTKIMIPIGNDIYNNTRIEKEINTKDILIICGGAFPDLADIIHNRLYRYGECDERNLLEHVTDEDIISFGIIPELLGRLPIITTLDEFTVDMFRDVLDKPRNSLIDQYKQLFEIDQVNLTFENDALDTIAEIACMKKKGARALRGIMENLLEPLMFEAPNFSGSEFIITKKFINGDSGSLIIK